MEENQFSRTELLIGKEGLSKLKNSKVAIFGIGGVGSFVVEALARAGVQNFVLVYILIPNAYLHKSHQHFVLLQV